MQKNQDINIKNRDTGRKYFHCYATANDRSLYLRDINNLMRIREYPSGVKHIQLFIAISKVRNIDLFDRFFVKMVHKIFHEHPLVELTEVYFKDNIGRDFGSFQSLFQKVKETAHPDDYILFQNRSGYGPFRENWYRGFAEQFEKFDSIALCGSTINFMDNPERSMNSDLPHVQTYSFMTGVYFMDMLKDGFTGSDKTERLDIILNGEIGLSQFFLERDFKITCIEWPDEKISAGSEPFVQSDIKEYVTADHYFYHRSYFRKNKSEKGKRKRGKYLLKYFLIMLGFSLTRRSIKLTNNNPVT